MDSLNFPPGGRFHPTDEELITHYLWRKMGDSSFSAVEIGEADMRRLDPWDLPDLGRERVCFFFSPRDRMYGIGQGIYRATYSGYWKTTIGKDTKIFKGKTLVGMKRTMSFYQGKSSKIWNTNWSMHEYRSVVGRSSSDDEWVICKVFLENKNNSSIISTKAVITPLLQPQDDDDDKLWVKLEYKNDIVKFVLSNPSMDGLNTQVLMRFSKSECYDFKFMYKDEEDGEMITIACDQDLQCCLEYFKLSGRIPQIVSSLSMNPWIAQQLSGLKKHPLITPFNS